MTSKIVGERAFGKKFIAALALAFFGTSMLDVLSSLFLVNLSKTFFGSSSLPTIAIVSQIVTISSIASVVFGVLNGFLSLRIDHKKLLLFGALCIVIGATGCYFASNFLMLQIFYPFDGIGTIVVGSMAFTLIGETIPLEKRAKAVGWVTGSAIFSTAIGFAVAGYVAASGWRSYLLWYVLPVSIVALAAAYLLVPSQHKQTNTQTYKGSFKEILYNKSAIACLIGYMFITASGVWSFYAATFWQKQFSITIQNVAIITVAVVLVYAFGGVLGGRLVGKVGRKPLVVSTWLLRGILIIAIVFMPTFISALIMSVIATLVGGFAMTAGHNLNLEQAQNAKGTMMSLGAVFGSIGASLGVSMGALGISYRISSFRYNTWHLWNSLSHNSSYTIEGPNKRLFYKTISKENVSI